MESLGNRLRQEMVRFHGSRERLEQISEDAKILTGEGSVRACSEIVCLKTHLGRN